MNLRISYIARSFLDYRIPVFDELSKLIDGNFTVIFSKDVVPERVVKRAQETLGEKAVGLTGEKSLGYRGNITSEFSNTKIRIPWQPGILKVIEKNKPDVLIGDGFSQWTLSALVYRLARNKPLVICYEKTAHTERNAQWYRNLYRKSVLYFIDVMCVNGSLSKSYVESIGIPSNRITTGNMVADVNALIKKNQNLDLKKVEAIKKQFGIPLDSVVFISVSKLIKLKGIAEFLKSWGIFTKQVSNKIHFLIVGNGTERRNLELICHEFMLKNVTFTGEIDYTSIHNYYSVADIFVMPTLEDNWSLVVPEAMACGLPVICSKYNGCWPELVLEGLNGWVFDPLNVQDTVRVLVEANQNKFRLSDMGKCSKEIVSQYTPRTAAQAILSACQIALAHWASK